MKHSRTLAVCTLSLLAVLLLLPYPLFADAGTQTPMSAAASVKPVAAPDEAHRAAAEAILQQLWSADFSMIAKVVRQCDESDNATRDAVIWLALAYMKDTNRDPVNRWPCCYVVSDCKYEDKTSPNGKYEPAIPDLIALLQSDDAAVMRSVSTEALGHLFLSTLNGDARQALIQATKDGNAEVRRIAKMYVAKMKADPTLGKSPVNSPDDPHRKAADALLKQIWDAEPGQAKFDAIDAVVREYKASDAATQNAIVWLCLTYMRDEERSVPDRWPCIYVLARAKYMPAVPYMIYELLNDPVDTMRAVAAEALGGLYKDTSDKAIRDALLQAVRTERSQRVRDVIAKYVNPKEIPPVPNPPDDAHRRAADTILKQIWDAEPGAPKFVAIDAVVKQYNASDAATQNAIVWLCLTYLNDETRGILDRWPCCYVISGIKYEDGVPYLVDVLQHNGVEVMRAVAAEALGAMYLDTHSVEIHDTLLAAARTEKSKRVLDTIAKYLKEIPPVPNPPDDVHRKAADAILKQIWDAEPGAPKFVAINAVVKQYNGTDAATQKAIVWLCLTYLNDTTRGILDRWPCCYVISGIKYEDGVPYLVDVLQHNGVEAMRAVAAEALGAMYLDTRSVFIHDTLLAAARTEESKRVLDTIAKYLGKEMPAH